MNITDTPLEREARNIIMQLQVCARSWGELNYWTFCTLPRGHEGTCSMSGIPKPPHAKYFEEQPEAALEIQKQIEDERKMIAKKAAKKANLPTKSAPLEG